LILILKNLEGKLDLEVDEDKDCGKKNNVEKELEDASNLSGKKKVKSLKHVFYEIQIFPKWFGGGLIKVFAIFIFICYLDANVCLYVVKPHLMRLVLKPCK
jgi:hypothetical protein